MKLNYWFKAIMQLFRIYLFLLPLIYESKETLNNKISTIISSLVSRKQLIHGSSIEYFKLRLTSILFKSLNDKGYFMSYISKYWFTTLSKISY